MRASFLIRHFLRRGAVVGVAEHILFSEHQRLGFQITFEKPPAQQGKFLKRDFVLPNQAEIRAHGDLLPRPVG
jgi:hypothetical protein